MKWSAQWIGTNVIDPHRPSFLTIKLVYPQNRLIWGLIGLQWGQGVICPTLTFSWKYLPESWIGTKTPFWSFSVLGTQPTTNRGRSFHFVPPLQSNLPQHNLAALVHFCFVTIVSWLNTAGTDLRHRIYPIIPAILNFMATLQLCSNLAKSPRRCGYLLPILFSSPYTCSQ